MLAYPDFHLLCQLSHSVEEASVAENKSERVSSRESNVRDGSETGYAPQSHYST